MRRAHYIRDNKASDYPQQCIWFDTETLSQPIDEDSVSHHLNIGYACYMRKHRDGKWTDETWLRFTTRAEFWQWVLSKVRSKTKLYLFCHNTNFDLPVLNVFNDLPLLGCTLLSAIIDGPPTILQFRFRDSRIVILDTLNFWRMPLAILGQQIGLEKYEQPDFDHLSPELERYAKRDVEIIRTACINWFDYLEQNDMGSFANTLAAQSMRIYRHKYMTHKIWIDNNERSLKLTRAGYYGGRVECFQIGEFKGDFWNLDVNSMYPFCMYQYEFPYQLIGHSRFLGIKDMEQSLRSKCVTARVDLETKIPFAPVRKDGRLLFPVGRFECILSTPELAYALENATIHEVHEMSIYEKAPLFREMAKAMTDLKTKYKSEGRFVEEFHAKKIINSFYGKWGQSGGKWDSDYNTIDLTAQSWIEINYETGERIRRRQLGGLVQVKTEEAESRDSFPAIAAHVTAHARMVLWDAIQIAGINNVFYCDTDSVVVNTFGMHRLKANMDDNRLGALKIVGNYDDIVIYGPKDYRFGTKVKHKGIRKDAEWIDANTVRQSQWSGLRGLVQNGQIDAPITRRITKHIKRIYLKGSVQPDGRVLPFELFPEHE